MRLPPDYVQKDIESEDDQPLKDEDYVDFKDND